MFSAGAIFVVADGSSILRCSSANATCVGTAGHGKLAGASAEVRKVRKDIHLWLPLRAALVAPSARCGSDVSIANWRPLLINGARGGYSCWRCAACRNGSRPDLRESSVGQIDFEDADVI
jgi:hypothetical protein